MGRYTTRYNREERTRIARWCKGWDLNPRFPNYQFGALPTWPPLHMVVLFICPRKHQTRVCKFYLYPTYRKVLALRLIELTCSTYIPHPAFGRRSIQLPRTSTRHLRIYLTYADLRLTNCLIFAHIRPVRRHGLSIE